jgi:uncharacterized protein YjbJ (UPF0337 family)
MMVRRRSGTAITPARPSLPPSRACRIHQRRSDMNTDIIKGKWKQLNGRIKQQWGELTDDDLKAAEGSRDYLAGKIQERYGIAKDAALDQVKDFEKRIDH